MEEDRDERRSGCCSMPLPARGGAALNDRRTPVMTVKKVQAAKGKAGSEADPGRQRIIEAMRRLLAGEPIRVAPGRFSVLALAEEAMVERNRLNREYAD